jgi:hypothetical protein
MRASTAFLMLLFSAGSGAQEGLLVVTGYGTVDAAKFATQSQGRMMAERAAQVDGQRQLAESIRGVELTGGTTVEEYEVTSDLVATRVRGLVRGAFVLDKKIVEESDTLVAEVQMAICIDDRAAVCAGKTTLQSIVTRAD